MNLNGRMFSPCRNLPHRISEANIRQIWTRWVSRQQCGGHKPPPDHGRAERRQTPLLPEPVMLLFSPPVWLCRSFLSSPLVCLSCHTAVISMPSWLHKSLTTRLLYVTFLFFFFLGRFLLYSFSLCLCPRLDFRGVCFKIINTGL